MQVRTAVEVGALPARAVRVPGALVDAVVVDPSQSMGYDVVYDPTMSGEIKGPPSPPSAAPFTVRQVIARRAAEELRDGAVINYGFGIPDGVAKIVAERGHLDPTTRPSSLAPTAAAVGRARCSATRAMPPP